MKTKLDQLATNLVGDGQAPNLFFVSRLAESTDETVSTVLTITADFGVAYRQWLSLSGRCPSLLPMLEDRVHGVLASVDRNEDTGRLECRDDTTRNGFAAIVTENISLSLA